LQTSATLFLSVTISILSSQEIGDYVIKMNRDTVFTRSVKIDRDMKAVYCEVDGKKIKLEARDLRSLKISNRTYETGLVRITGNGARDYFFLEKKISGTLNLYEIKVRTYKRSLSSLIEWARNGTPSKRDHWSDHIFYKKENDSRESFSGDWKEMTRDCNKFREQFNSDAAATSPDPAEVVRFYNANCK
jgi:hypothetical protein